MVRGLSKLRNLGQGYVNFGEPLPLMTYLNQHVPDWREAIRPDLKRFAPSWLTPTVNSIAADLMVRINNAGAANAMNLCCTALLASRQRSLTREQLTQQLERYLALLRNVPDSPDAHRPIRFGQRAHRSCTADEQVRSGEGHHWRHHHPAARAGGADDLLSQQYRPYAGDAVAVSRSGDSASSSQPRRSAASCGNTVSVPQGRAVPALGKAELAGVVDALIAEMLRQELIVVDGDVMSLNPSHSRSLQLLAAGARETLQRYAITFWLLSANPAINRSSLERESHRGPASVGATRHQCAGVLRQSGVQHPALTLRDEGYISDTGDAEPEETLKVYRMLADFDYVGCPTDH